MMNQRRHDTEPKPNKALSISSMPHPNYGEREQARKPVKINVNVSQLVNFNLKSKLKERDNDRLSSKKTFKMERRRPMSAPKKVRKLKTIDF